MSYFITLQYMIADKDSLQVKSISDELLKHELGTYGGEKENGMITWVKEPSLHVIGLRSTKAEANLNTLENAFADNIKLINKILTQWNALLLPTASHPFMNPVKETKLWSHTDQEALDIYNQIFNLNSHAWSNTQSTLFRIPFNSEKEFGKFHAAIRVLLPLLPALCASSPLIEGKPSGYLESRVSLYGNINSRIPSLTSHLIPEPIFSRKMYEAGIYDTIKKEVTPFNNGNILNPVELNFRAAIPRFDHGYIEIRIMDVQECATADIAVIALFTETVKALVNGKFAPMDDLKEAFTDALAGILGDTAQHGQSAEIYSTEYSSLFGVNSFTTPKELWQHIYQTLIKNDSTTLDHWEPELSVILEQGTLSERMLKELKGDFSEAAIRKVYRELHDCLAQNKMFIP
jgi:gamma-glutamyl:cysteine ligase YbdK (ATP-grasp superfamily)